MFSESGAADWAREAGLEVARWELEQEMAYTRPIDQMVRRVAEWARQGKRVVAISDSRYTSEELAYLLDQHQISGIRKVYSSADYGKSKFSGRLFDEVVRAESAAPREILHIGDDFLADVVSPSQRGLVVGKVKRPKRSGGLIAAPLRSDDARDAAFSLGYEVMGPVLVAFTRLLFEASRRDGIEHLAFVARDGELLLRVAQALNRNEEFPCLSYLQLSRRATMCTSPELQALDGSKESADRVLKQLKSIRSMGSFVEQFRNYYGISPELVFRHSGRLAANDGSEAGFMRFLSDRLFISELQSELPSRRDLIRRYLVQEEVLSNRCALVDIGWRGSLQALLEAQCQGWGLPCPSGYYFGLWNDDDGHFPAKSCGLIADQRRGRNLLEGSAGHLAFLWEAVCRARHGMVNGFLEDDDGIVRATYVTSGHTREVERATEEAQARIQVGVMSYVSWYSSKFQRVRIDESAVRRAAQKRLFELAFFPTAKEISVGRELVHSEPTSEEIALPLILTPAPGVGGLLSGIRSPWKGGFIRAFTGDIGACIYAAFEAILCRCPLGSKSTIRRLMIHD
jgi:hypothetical protein